MSSWRLSLSTKAEGRLRFGGEFEIFKTAANSRFAKFMNIGDVCTDSVLFFYQKHGPGFTEFFTFCSKRSNYTLIHIYLDNFLWNDINKKSKRLAGLIFFKFAHLERLEVSQSESSSLPRCLNLGYIHACKNSCHSTFAAVTLLSDAFREYHVLSLGSCISKDCSNRFGLSNLIFVDAKNEKWKWKIMNLLFPKQGWSSIHTAW